MGANCACSLLFCAVNRSGAFPPNMPAGLGGFCITSRRFHEADLRVIASPAGARLFVITGEAVTSRSRSPPILMGWWSVKRCDYTKGISSLVELANAAVRRVAKKKGPFFRPRRLLLVHVHVRELRNPPWGSGGFLSFFRYKRRRGTFIIGGQWARFTCAVCGTVSCLRW